ncbi:stage II sporulation protein M [Amycolatopsis sp. PS_44_ISF1]|uniref:stage II sporulation protein M n=1 Tax=Amycolatopsis sp. PS_44_ISF1 TaxID=2974917 RepID=UPI0028DF9CC1|nr:stage II sporulation protein M [Amycolatopsis sp. PS_44_ISF1]MDT8912094.1 stage II sporulation protein M [Amycolatopsis sp. PS_44_ISF1]MDT8912246.1 stage II sporulation protein M [Amycolatopsis sp. PS_44_ISF1]
MDFLRAPLHIIRADLRAYLITNAIAYGALILGMVLSLIFPALRAARTASFAVDQGALVTSVVGNPWAFGVLIFLVNVFATALLLIVLPSVVVPFAGVAIFAVKAVDLGILTGPVDRVSSLTLIPHSVTLLVEFQAYVLIMFGAYLLGRSWIRPATIGATTRRTAYLQGIKRLAWLWIPALTLLVIGAAYEVLEIYVLVPKLLGP